MDPKHSSLRFPLWKYLNQPLFDTSTPMILSPKRFWALYQVQFLERCLARDCESESRPY